MAPLAGSEVPTASPDTVSKRPAATLLPAFEPLSSSPALPRPLKRTRDALDEEPKYPTPVPTSSTLLQSSSPSQANVLRPSIKRTFSALSERAPLAAVPTISLSSDGIPVKFGRSSVSCDYQLSSNRLVSRVHVKACYKAASSSLERPRVEVTCSGWNGVKVHCKGERYELKRGDTFSSDIKDVDIMLDVHDNRVVLRWPAKPHLGPISSDEEEDEPSPSKKQRAMLRHSTPPSPSPVQTRRRAVSPISPSPAVQALLPSSPPLGPLAASTDTVQIYEDPDVEGEENKENEDTVLGPSQAISTQVLSQMLDPSRSHDSDPISSLEYSDNDEENDPIVHSFGPFGANLLPRMASVRAGDSPRATTSLKSSRSSHTEPLQNNISPTQPSVSRVEFDIKDHIINQLAYSRLSSTPLSTILSHLPHEADVRTTDTLRNAISQIPCIGEVQREGKDAAGKALESEFYYIPDEDEDESRKAAVVNDLRKPGLRACRKQHKQYYWRKPK